MSEATDLIKAILARGPQLSTYERGEIAAPSLQKNQRGRLLAKNAGGVGAQFDKLFRGDGMTAGPADPETRTIRESDSSAPVLDGWGRMRNLRVDGPLGTATADAGTSMSPTTADVTMQTKTDAELDAIITRDPERPMSPGEFILRDSARAARTEMMRRARSKPVHPITGEVLA